MLSVTKRPPPVAALKAARAAVSDEGVRSNSVVEDPWRVPFDKVTLQKALCAEQGHLCAYCGARIEATGTGMIVEHWVPRSVDSSIDSVFDWSNLFGVCVGRYHGPCRNVDHRPEMANILHCDQSRTKGEHLFHRPTDIPLHSLGPFQVKLNGPSPFEAGIHNEAELIERAGRGEAFRDWLSPVNMPTCTHSSLHDEASCAGHDIKELNLNALKLVNDRATVISSMSSRLAQSAGSEPRVLQDHWRAATKGSGPLPAFAHIQIQYLRKKAKRYGLTLSPP
jgi:hypothetical protein